MPTLKFPNCPICFYPLKLCASYSNMLYYDCKTLYNKYHVFEADISNSLISVQRLYLDKINIASDFATNTTLFHSKHVKITIPLINLQDFTINFSIPNDDIINKFKKLSVLI